MEKICNACDKPFPATLDFFPKHNKTKSGLRAQCKGCFNQKARQWSKDNPTKARKIQTRSRLKHAAAHKALNAAWAAANPAKVKASVRAYARSHPEVIRSRNINRKARKRNAPGRFTANDIRLQLKKQDGLCYWCDEPLIDFHIDHLMPLSRGGTNWPANIVCACPPCNLKKSDKLPEEFAAEISEGKHAHL